MKSGFTLARLGFQSRVEYREDDVIGRRSLGTMLPGTNVTVRVASRQVLRTKACLDLEAVALRPFKIDEKRYFNTYLLVSGIWLWA